MSKDKLDGFEAARKIDKILSDLLEKHPMRKEWHEWWKLTRTIQSSLDIIEHGIKTAMFSEGEEGLKIKGQH